jgi:hypothetical protein
LEFIAMAILILGVVIGLGVLVLASVLVPFNVRRVRTARRAAELPEDIRRQVLELIDLAGKADGTLALLLRRIDGPGTDPYSRIGGAPVLPPEVVLPPSHRGTGSVFLGQVRLQSPPLPEAWSNRVVLLFKDAAGALSAFSAGPAEPLRRPVLPSAPSLPLIDLTANGLEPLRLPLVDSNDDGIQDAPARRSSYQPVPLMRRIPALRQLLSSCSDSPERLLPHILVPGIGTHEIDTFHVCLMGSEPELIQSEHDAICGKCLQSMRFLFQLGDVLGLPGDAPVVYVYGCDADPDELSVHSDMH